ncbi:hypothetical protein [Paenibacillus kribbensis]|uniref:hypothetical protein n=1 Tax=Paenibacillus kribbensis TaxID=172713 RepID=UPI00083851C8|nr:hypothetical protein [Paenibacillus kribbensis]
MRHEDAIIGKKVSIKKGHGSYIGRIGYITSELEWKEVIGEESPRFGVSVDIGEALLLIVSPENLELVQEDKGDDGFWEVEI